MVYGDKKLKTKQKELFIIVILVACLLPSAAVAGLAKAPASQQGSNEVWEPFHPVRNPTLKVIVDPHAHATLNSQSTWVLEWRPDHYVYPGTQIELRSLNLRSYFSWKYSKIEIEGAGADISFRRRAELSPSQIFAIFGKWIIFRAHLQYGLREGQPLRIRLTATPPYVAGLFDAVTIWYSNLLPGNRPEPKQREFVKDPRAQAILQAGPGPATRLAVYSWPTPGADGKVRTLLDPEDRYGNPSRFDESIPVKLQWNGKTWSETLQGTKIIQLDPPKDIGRLKVSIPMKDLSPNENVSNGLGQGDRLVVTGNPVWAHSPNGQVAGFGEFHWHTEISGDGGNSLPSGLEYARDHLNLDYISPSDHTPNEAQWKYEVGVLNSFNDPGHFATFFGYEHSTNHGHENYYFANPEHPVSPVGVVGSQICACAHGLRSNNCQELYDLTRLPQMLNKYDTPNDRFIGIPHHSNANSETHRLSDDTPYWFAYPWTHPGKYHRLAEIFQTRGNMERDAYPEDAWRGWHSNGSSVQDGLAHGYKLGFTAGSDNHTSRPANAFAAREDLGRVPVDSISLTGLWTDGIERGKVFNALYARHTWAVWDTRALVYFTVNGAQAGDAIEVKKGQPLTAQIKMSAEDALQSIEIVSEKKPVWVASKDQLDFDIKVPLGKAEHSTYFYLRALQRNGGIIYASPVFVSVK